MVLLFHSVCVQALRSVLKYNKLTVSFNSATATLAGAGKHTVAAVAHFFSFSHLRFPP